MHKIDFHPKTWADDSIDVHPVLEVMAMEMYDTTPLSVLPSHLPRHVGMWTRLPPETRTWYRDRARAFAAGNMRVAPWVIAAERMAALQDQPGDLHGHDERGERENGLCGCVE